MNAFSRNRNAIIAGGAVTLCVIAMLSSCGQKDSVKVEPTYTYLYDNVFKGDCAKCHATGKDAGNALDLTQDKAALYTTLTTSQPKKNNPLSSLACTTAQLIKASDSAYSYLWVVVSQNESTRSTYAAKFPTCTIAPEDHTSLTLTADQKTALKSWIDAGAPNN